ncbi:MAG: Uma2 family endonuclease [Deinococcota bacterium]|nr:Uma2 family endonuclease [Deinococcota bacterium]
MTTRVRFTYEDLQDFQDDKRREVIEGEIYVTPAPAPRHQRIVGSLYFAVRGYLQNHAIGEIFVAPVDVIFSAEDVTQPDLVYVANERAAIVTTRGIEGPPSWVVEVLSPSTQKRDMGIKLKLYQTYGLGAYWVVDPEDETVYAWDDGFVLNRYRRDEVAKVSLLADFALPLGELF